MPLIEGLRRITLLPAQWLALASEDFSRKGRIQVGADADIVIFDADEMRHGLSTEILTKPH